MRLVKALGWPAAAFLFVSACASGPLAPRLIKSDGNGSEVLVSRCRNVAKDQEVSGLVTDSYLTTWGGVYGEVWESNTEMDTPIAAAGTSILFRMPPGKTFCMRFDAGVEEVNQAIEDTRAMLGIKFILAKPGEYETDYALRSAKLGKTQWKEKYLIFISKNLVRGTDVRVYREVLISREEAQPGQSREFFESTSVGHNEAWYLLQVNERLSK